MNNFIIEKYISKLTKQDIINYTKIQNISLSDKELNIIYTYIKTKYKDFLTGNQKEILDELKSKISPKNYQELEKLFHLYQNKI